MKCIYRRSQTDGRQIENREDVFHVLSFMFSFYSSRASTAAAVLLSLPSSPSVLSAGYQVKVKCMPLSALGQRTNQASDEERNGKKKKKKKTQTLLHRDKLL